MSFTTQSLSVPVVAANSWTCGAPMRWSILTPELSIHWDGECLSEGPGATRADAPSGDPLEETWRTYYSSIFNPARLKVGAMLKEMPKKYWRNMISSPASSGSSLSTSSRCACPPSNSVVNSRRKCVSTFS